MQTRQELSQRPDWQEAHARLERWRQALDAGEEPRPAEVRRVLRQRARALAQPRPEGPQTDGGLPFLVFSRAGAAYAVAAGEVLEVFPLPDLTRVPGTPQLIPGVVLHRGKVLTVVDLGGLSGTSVANAPDRGCVVAVGTNGKQFGLLAETVEGIVAVRAADLVPYSGTRPGDRPPCIRAVTPDMAAVVDLNALLRGQGAGMEPVRN